MYLRLQHRNLSRIEKIHVCDGIDAPVIWEWRFERAGTLFCLLKRLRRTLRTRGLLECKTSPVCRLTHAHTAQIRCARCDRT
jgi:hypothetical protein